MSLSRRNPRRDANEKQIVDDLRAAGAYVWRVSGSGLPDLLVRFQGRYYVGEVKTLKGKLTKAQGAFPIWRSSADVFKAIGVTKCST